MTNYLVSLIAAPKSKQRLVLTTHSPYVLANVNNLLKAGAIAKCSKAAQSAIERVVPKDSWLDPAMLRAYAIKDGETATIVDEDGLINGEYLDDVSGNIAREFSQLLEIELKECR